MRALIERETSIANATAAIYVFSSRPAAEFNESEGVGVDPEAEEPVEDNAGTPLEADKPYMISYVCT